MTEADGDARIAEVVTGILRLRRHLDGQSFADLLGAIQVEIETGDEILAERGCRRRPTPVGNVVPFRGPAHVPGRDEDGR